MSVVIARIGSLKLVQKEYLDRETVLCPNCGSKEIYANVIVSGSASVNVNTLELWDLPEECDCCWDDVDSETELVCHVCGHEWERDQ